MGGNESSGREHANITLAMRWTQREMQTKEEVGSQVLYAARGEGVQQGKRFLRTSYADGPEEGGCGRLHLRNRFGVGRAGVKM